MPHDDSPLLHSAGDGENERQYTSFEETTLPKRITSKQMLCGGLILCVLAVGISIIVLLSPSSSSSSTDDDGKRELVFEDLFSSDFRSRSFTSRWSSSNAFTTMETDANGARIIYRREIGEEPTVMVNETLLTYPGTEDPFSFFDYDVSPDESMVLLASDRQSIWRHSFSARYFVYTVATGELASLTSDQDEHLRCPTFSPTLDHVSFVRPDENNVYIVDVSTGDETQVTTEGTDIRMFGVPDWVVEEEILGEACAMWWSPAGDYLSYLEVNDEGLQDYNIQFFYGDPYPEEFRLPYPKVGTTNPVLNLHVYDLDTAEVVTMDYSNDEFGDERIIGRVGWADDEHMWVRTMNRIQNEEALFINQLGGAGSGDLLGAIALEQDGGEGWLEWHDSVYFLDAEGADGEFDHIIDLRTHPDHNNPHVALYDFGGDSNDLVKFVTQGEDWMVTRIYGYDEVSSRVYFSSTLGGAGLDGALSVHLCYVHLSLDAEEHEPSCFATNGVYSASFSPGFDNMIITASGPAVPHYLLFSRSDVLASPVDASRKLAGSSPRGGLMFGADSENVDDDECPTTGWCVDDMRVYDEAWELTEVLEDNAALAAHVDTIRWPKRSFLYNIDSAEEGTYLNGWLTVADGGSTREPRPMLMYQYSGPGSISVSLAFDKTGARSLFHYWLATQGIHVACVDGRGTGRRGDSFLKSTYLRLGEKEVEDQFAAAAFLTRHYREIDPERVGIWGWSYGGFMASSVLATQGTDKEVPFNFKMGIAVAPVASWEYYDTMYTERYMSTPDVNEAGYRDMSVTHLIESGNFPEDSYLLAHGLADDNVHYQNAAEIANSLVKEGKQFEMFAFTNQDHSINQDGSSEFLYRLMSNFIDRRLRE